MPGVFGTTPVARGYTPPKAKPRPAPVALPPILHAQAPPASSYKPQSHAQAYAQAPHHYTAPTAPVPSTAGHWVNVKGKWVPIYATGKGKWTQGFKTLGGQTLAHPGKPSQSAALKPAGTDAGSGYGSAAANAFKKTPAYTKAVLDVFEHQSPAQQKAIVNGALKHKTPEGDAILSLLNKAGGTRAGMLGLASIAPSITRAQFGAISDKLTGTLSGAEQFVQNFGNDAYNLAPGTIEGLAGVGKDIVTGHPGTAFHALLDPYVQLALHPAKTAFKNPLNTALMLAAPESIAGKGVGAVMRSGALGERAAAAGSIVRDDLHVGTVAGEPSPIVESRQYSKDVLRKGGQVLHERHQAKRGLNPNVSRESDSALRQAAAMDTHGKLNRMTDEESAMRQALGRTERARAMHAAIKHAPHKDVRNIVPHILQGIVRKPETAVADIEKEVNRLKAQAGTKRTLGEIQRRRQVRDLEKAAKSPHLHEAFNTADILRPILHKQDAHLAAKGLLHPGQAMRRTLMTYAMAHMGAKYEGGRLVKAHVPDEAKVAEEAKVQAKMANVRGLIERPGTAGEGAAALSRHGQLWHRLVGLHHELDEEGAPDTLTNEEILAHLQANGVPDPAFVAHTIGKTSARHFYQAYRMARGQLGNRRTSMTAFTKGHYDHTYQGLMGQVASRAEAVTKASLHDRVISRFGIKMPKGVQDGIAESIRNKAEKQIRESKLKGDDAARVRSKAREEIQKVQTGMFTRKEAEAFAQASKVDDNGNPIPGALNLRPISAAPAHVLGDVEDLQHPLDMTDPGPYEMRALQHALEDATHSTARNLLLVPEDVIERFAQHYKSRGGWAREIGQVVQQFRRTVLPYSTHWMAQIGTEAALRGLIAGALSPHYWLEGHRLMKQLTDTEEGRHALSEMVGGAFFHGAQDPNMIFNPNRGKISHAVHAAPVMKQIIGAHNKYANLIGGAMYELEHQFRIAGMGKLAHREVTEFATNWKNAVKIQGDALAHLAGNLRNDPALVARLGREIDNTFGKYNKFSPKVRAAVQTVAPFLPWYLNAAKYVFWTLPKDHPVSSALMASLRQTLNQDIADGKKAPLNVWAMQEMGRLSPFGIFTPPSTKPSTGGFIAGQQGLDMFMPYVSGPVAELIGKSPFLEGNLRGSGGQYGRDIPGFTGPAAAAAGENAIESVLPGVRFAREQLEHTAAGFDTSTLVKPQGKGPQVSESEVLKRMFHPFRGLERSQSAATAPKYGDTTPKSNAKKKSGGADSFVQAIGSSSAGSAADSFVKALGKSQSGGSADSFVQSLGGG